MALVYKNNHNEPLQPPSPSLTNPDMILPYDPRLRDSGSTQHSGGLDISSLNDQMVMSLDNTRAANRAGKWQGHGHRSRPSMPGEWQTESDINATTPTEKPAPAPSTASAETEKDSSRPRTQGPTYKLGTSFLNLDRFSTISAVSATKSDGSAGAAIQEEAPIQEELETEEEVNARNDFARAEEILANAKKRLTVSYIPVDCLHDA